MSYVLNDPADFSAEAIDGFSAAHADLVMQVPGGVVRRAARHEGEVAIVIGGGSGHYPAFAGLVGPGLAHGAALGNVFASPSARQVFDVAKAVAGPAGVLLSYGNYAGDVLNFDQAQRMLLDEGIPCTTVRVTDDVYSADPAERDKRRGIAGDLAVFKAAAWKSEQGASLVGVADFASHANDMTRSVGVAFSGCTLPGAHEPLFTVPAGRMAVGMGIHGEPGIDVVPLLDARGIATLLTERLLAERPRDATGRVAVILNGLGSVKSEELYVLYNTVAERLVDAGVTIVEPEIGEYATSFEMAGVSLTLFWLDEDLERAWRAPAYTPGYRKRAVPVAADDAGPIVDLVETRDSVPHASTASRSSAADVCAVLLGIRDAIDREADELGRLDAVAGDGDHGIGMRRGARAAFVAAEEALAAGAGAGTVLARAGDSWADRAGGTSGALWGAGLRVIGDSIGDEEAPSAVSVAQAVQEGRRAVQEYGKAFVGDKTLVDALVPFAQTLSDRAGNGESLATAWAAAADVASRAAAGTANLVPRVGRARPHAEKSVGTPDPGAVSFALAMDAAAAVLSTREPKTTRAREK